MMEKFPSLAGALLCVLMSALTATAALAKMSDEDKKRYEGDYDACMEIQNKKGQDDQMTAFLSCMRARGYKDEDLIIEEVEPGYENEEQGGQSDAL